MCKKKPPKKKSNRFPVHLQRDGGRRLCGRDWPGVHTMTSDIAEVTCGACICVIKKKSVHMASDSTVSGVLCGYHDSCRSEMNTTSDPSKVTCKQCLGRIARNAGSAALHYRDSGVRGKTLCGVDRSRGCTDKRKNVTCRYCKAILDKNSAEHESSPTVSSIASPMTVPKEWRRVLDYYPPGAYVELSVLMKRLNLTMRDAVKIGSAGGLKPVLTVDNQPCLRLPLGLPL